MATYERKFFDLTFLADNCMQDNRSRDTSAHRQSRIRRFYSVNQGALGYALGDADSLGLRRDGRPRNRTQARGLANNAADDSSQLPTGYTSWHSSDHTRGRRWGRFLFVNYLNFRRYPAGGPQLAAAQHFALGLPDQFGHRLRRGRGWRRRWRWRHQECQQLLLWKRLGEHQRQNQQDTKQQALYYQREDGCKLTTVSFGFLRVQKTVSKQWSLGKPRTLHYSKFRRHPDRLLNFHSILRFWLADFDRCTHGPSRWIPCFNQIFRFAWANVRCAKSPFFVMAVTTVRKLLNGRRADVGRVLSRSLQPAL